MKRKFISMEEFITFSQGSINDFSIKERFKINSVRRNIATNGTPYYKLNLKYKTGSLDAKRFTSGQFEFESLNDIYLVGKKIEIEGIYQLEWRSVKITSEKLNKSSNKEDLCLDNRDSFGKNFHEEKLPLIKNQNEKFEELIKLIEFETTIQIKSYINDIFKPILNVSSNKKKKEYKKLIKKHIKTWPEDRRVEVWNECSRTSGRYETLQPAKWSKWGNRLFKLISVLR